MKEFSCKKYLHNQINGRLKVHAKVNKDPVNAFTFIFFLLEYEHVMIKELLQSFVRIINAKLFESIELRLFIKSSESKSQNVYKHFCIVIGVHHGQQQTEHKSILIT